MRYVLGAMVLAIGFSTISAFAAYKPDCKQGETKFVYDSTIKVGTRVQVFNPSFCVDGLDYAVLGALGGAGQFDTSYSEGICGLMQMGTIVTADYLDVQSAYQVAAFDKDGKFVGIHDYVDAYAINSITCETGE